MACGVASYGWGASGLPGIPMMGAGPVGTKGMLLYCVGLAISCVMGFVLTFFTVPAERVKDVQKTAPAYRLCRVQGRILAFSEKMC